MQIADNNLILPPKAPTLSQKFVLELQSMIKSKLKKLKIKSQFLELLLLFQKNVLLKKFYFITKMVTEILVKIELRS